MIRITNKEIHIPRGDTATLQFEILNKKGEPYIMPKDMVNPAIIFAVSKKTASLRLTDELLIAKYFPIYKYQDNYQFNDNILPESEDKGQKNQVFAANDGTFYYYPQNSTDKVPYRFVITVQFTPDDTNRLVNNTYRYNVMLVDTKDTEEWLLSDESEFEVPSMPDDPEMVDPGFTFLNRDKINLDNHINQIFWKDTLIDTNNFVVEDVSYALV